MNLADFDAMTATAATQPAATGLRRAALALHALSAGDRAWLLDQLGASQQQRLRELLAELDALGTRFDPADIEALMSSAPASMAAAERQPDWRSAWPQEPDWVIGALEHDSGLFAPAARAALLAAAARAPVQATPQVFRATAAVPTPEPALTPTPTPTPQGWLAKVRRWLP